MGLFDWLTTPKAPFLYPGVDGRPSPLTAEQYGEKCLESAAGIAVVKAIELSALGKDRVSSDVLAKIRQFRLIALTHGTAFFVAVECTYPVIRLGIPNEVFKGIMIGVNNTIKNRAYFLRDQPNDPEYHRILISEIGKYCAALLETAGTANQPDQDRMLLGIGGACGRLIHMLEQEYSRIPSQQASESEQSSLSTNTSGESNEFEGTFKNPGVEARQNVNSQVLIASLYNDTATYFVKSHDTHKSLALAQ